MGTRVLLATLLTSLTLLVAGRRPLANPSATVPAETRRVLKEEGGSSWSRLSDRPLVTIMLFFRHELGLSPEQVIRFERLRADFQREAIRRDAELRIAETDLAVLLDADAHDMTQVEAKVREVERLRADLRLARIRTIERAKAELTPEQMARLRSLVAAPPVFRSR